MKHICVDLKNRDCPAHCCEAKNSLYFYHNEKKDSDVYSCTKCFVSITFDKKEREKLEEALKEIAGED